MLSHDTRILRTTTVCEVEEPERLLRQSHRNPSRARQIDHTGTDAKERAPLPTADELERDASFHLFADQAAYEERPVSTVTAPVVPLMSK